MSITITDVELPAARLLLPAGAERNAWLGARKGGLGGSDMSTIAGVNPYSSLYELWLDKTGRTNGKPASRRMKMGNILEPVVRSIFEDETGLTVTPCGLVESIDHPILRYTPDGIVSDRRLFEAKTTNWRNADDWADGQVADHAEVQVQSGMAVTGLDAAWVAVMIDGDPDKYGHQLIRRDQALIDTLTDMAERFWHDHVLADVAPPITAQALDIIKSRNSEVNTSERAADPAIVAPLIAQRREAAATIKAAEALKDEAEAKLIDLIGDAETLVAAGEKQFTYKLQSRTGFDIKAMLADHPDIDPTDYQTSTAFRVFRLPAIKKAK